MTFGGELQLTLRVINISGGFMPRKRKDRSDMKVGTFEKKHGLPPGTIRNKTGRDTRSDARLRTIRKKSK